MKSVGEGCSTLDFKNKMELNQLGPAVIIQKQCPLCMSHEIRPVVSGRNSLKENSSEVVREFDGTWIQLLECRSCGFGFTKEIPVDPSFFQERYDIRFDPAQENKNPFKDKIFKDIFNMLARHGCRSGLLLDVGSFAGTFLGKAQSHGFSVEGIEVNPTMATYTKSKLGLNIRQGEFLKIDVQSNHYDVISFIDVLEHLVNPRQVIEKSAESLKPGGFLLIKVPNFRPQLYKQKIANLLGISNLGIFENFGHINHFSPRALKSIFTEMNLQTCEIGVADSEKWPRAHFKNRVKNLIRSGVFHFTVTAHRTIGVNAGMNIVALAQKKT